MALTNSRSRPGKVTVSNDAQNIYVTYTVADDDWYISDTRRTVVRTVGSIPEDGTVPEPVGLPACRRARAAAG